jgi:adenylate cyclase
MPDARSRGFVLTYTLALGFSAALLAWLIGLIPFVRTIELKAYDLRVARLAGASPGDATGPALVLIDDDSLRRMEPLVGRWPWPRLVHAMLIDFLAAGGAKAIAYDILFAEADIRPFKVGDTDWTGAESDRALVDSTAKAGTVIHAAEVSSAELLDPSRALVVPLDDIPALNRRYAADGCVEKRPQITPPFPALARAARAIGHTLVVLDDDGPIRRLAPFVRVADRLVPSLSLAAAMLADDAAPADARVEGGALVYRGRRLPLVEQAVPDYYGDAGRACRGLVAWRGPTMSASGQPTFQSWSAYDLIRSQEQVLAGEKPDVDPAQFRGRVVVVGTSAQGLGDVFTTPFAEGDMPGPEVHANVIDALIAGRAIGPVPGWRSAALTIGAALAVALAGALASAWVSGTVAAVVLASMTWFSVARFAVGEWWPLTVPALAVAFAFVGDLAWQYFVEGREKRQVKKLFSRYVSKDVYDQLIADPARAALGGNRRAMSVLFSDVRGFTTLTEKGAPEEIVSQLNEYFTRMVQVVFAHRGTVDKFVGDMVMALFGAPLDDEDHAEHAVEAALAMVRELEALNRVWAAQGRATLDIGIGVNSGDMVAGNIGSETIMSYTVIGDAVNLGARLESLNKEYGTRIIISEATRARLKGRYHVRPLGEVVVKGKSLAVAIFEVKSHDTNPAPVHRPGGGDDRAGAGGVAVP